MTEVQGDAVRHPLLIDYPVVISIPVQWGEMDAYGHVNNTVFFRFFESARIEYLNRCGFISSYDNDRIGAILHSTSCRFRAPLYYPDAVQVGARATVVGTDRFTMRYAVISMTHEIVAADGEAIIVSFDYASRAKTPLPSSVQSGIERLEGNGRAS